MGSNSILCHSLHRSPNARASDNKLCHRRGTGLLFPPSSPIQAVGYFTSPVVCRFTACAQHPHLLEMPKYRWKKNAKMRAKQLLCRSNAKGKGIVMAHQRAFDPHTFLAKVGAGRTIVACQQQSPIFAQGDAADAVFYIVVGLDHGVGHPSSRCPRSKHRNDSGKGSWGTPPLILGGRKEPTR
jgi:hypothetical protein